VVFAGSLTVGRSRRQFPEAVQYVSLAVPVIKVAEKLQCLLMVNGSSREIPVSPKLRLVG
jgi:hypothetical protein